MDNKVVIQLALEDGQYKVGVVNAGNLMREFKRTLEQTAASVKKVEQVQDGMGRKFRDLVLTLGNLRFVAMDINDVFLRLPMAVLKTAGEIERLQQLMSGLSKETERAARVAEGMRDFNFVANMARNAPFQLTALSDSFVKLKTAGIDPTNGSMQALVDSVARFGGTGDTLKRATVAIQQMAGKGVISMEELRQQLGEAVPTAMQDMADAMGMSMSQLAEKVSKGIVVAGPALEKMLLQMKVRNRGAAKEMMETWTGVTAQLETEWGLAAKAIADAGFGDAAKGAVRDLIAMLRSDEFKKFGLEVGNTLGAVVKDIVSVVKFFAQYREEIVMLGQAWLAYKVIYSGLIPAIERVRKVTETAQSTAARTIRDSIESAQGKRNEALAAAAAANQEANAKAVALARKMQMDREELASLRSKNAIMVAERARALAQLTALERRAHVAGLNDGGARDKYQAYLRQIAATQTEVARRQREVGESLANSVPKYQAASREAAEKARAMGELANQSRAAQMAAKGAALGAAAFGGAINLLGGPLSAAILALTALVWWFDRSRRKAEEFQQTVRQINAGMANDDAVKAAEENLEKTQQQYRLLARMSANEGLNRGASEKEKAKRAADLAKAQADWQEAQRLVIQARLGANQNATRQAVSDAEANAANEVAAIERATIAKNRALEQEFEKKKKTIQAGSKEEAKLRQDMAAKQRENDREGLLEQARYYENQAGRFAGDGGNERERAANLARYKAFMDKAKQLRDEAARDLKTDQSPVVLGGGDKTGTDKSKNPLSEAIEKVKEDNARLAAELAGLDETTGKVDNVFGAIAEVFQKWENGDYDFTGKDGKTKTRPTRAQLEPLLQGVVDAENIKNRTKQLQEAAKDVARVSDFINGMEPDIQAAMELIKDPLGTATRGPIEKRVEKFIGSNLKELEAYADKVGKTVDQVKAELVRDAVTADANNTLAKLVQDTAQLEAQMVDDARDAARAKAEADNERHRQRVQNIIDMAALEGATIEQQQQWQNILGRDMAARAKALEKQFETPIQKLASNWANATENMREASANWANASMDFMVELVTKGKADFRSLVTSILADLARIQLQKAMSPWLDIGANLLLGAFGFGGTTPASSGGSSIGVGAGGFTSGANYSFAGAKFANGGIMTEFGAAPLRKYAAGGVANSPQLALYGEGSMPEAYVPLPDGRTIPVTLKGAGQGGGTDVEINITVHQNGGESSSAKGSNANAFKQMGERVKAVVREELANQARPGGMLYR